MPLAPKLLTESLWRPADQSGEQGLQLATSFGIVASTLVLDCDVRRPLDGAPKMAGPRDEKLW